MTAASVWSATPAAAQAAAGGGSPTVSPRADGDTNVNADSVAVTCWVGCDFDTDGDEWELTPEGAQTASTVWLDSGSAGDVWVEFVRTAGATNWDSHTSSTRYRLNANVRFRNSQFRAVAGSSTKTITGYFRMWDAASGGNILWTGSTVEWRATATVFAGDKCTLC